MSLQLLFLYASAFALLAFVGYVWIGAVIDSRKKRKGERR